MNPRPIFILLLNIAIVIAICANAYANNREIYPCDNAKPHTISFIAGGKEDNRVFVVAWEKKGKCWVPKPEELTDKNYFILKRKINGKTHAFVLQDITKDIEETRGAPLGQPLKSENIMVIPELNPRNYDPYIPNKQ